MYNMYGQFLQDMTNESEWKGRTDIGAKTLQRPSNELRTGQHPFCTCSRFYWQSDFFQAFRSVAALIKRKGIKTLLRSQPFLCYLTQMGWTRYPFVSCFWKGMIKCKTESSSPIGWATCLHLHWPILRQIVYSWQRQRVVEARLMIKKFTAKPPLLGLWSRPLFRSLWTKVSAKWYLSNGDTLLHDTV